MLVTFSTDAYANITMFGDVAVNLLKMMGHSGTVPSAMMTEDIPAALSRLNAAISATKKSAPIKDIGTGEARVSMNHRALPLINLFSAAAKQNKNVIWK